MANFYLSEVVSINFPDLSLTQLRLLVEAGIADMKSTFYGHDEETPRWAVISCHKRQSKQDIARRVPKVISHHELLYGGKVISKMTGDAGLEKLHTIAKFSNRQGLVPRPAIQCLADDNGSIESRLKRQSDRADSLQQKARLNTVTPIGTP